MTFLRLHQISSPQSAVSTEILINSAHIRSVIRHPDHHESSRIDFNDNEFILVKESLDKISLDLMKSAEFSP
ncbi:hypothetical protein CEK28_05850 [Xenophilus sp. AP218F]|nr:hypothetical protein [Chromobacterium sp. ASV5]OWY40247.1 hypothetical protein CEK28_05850 [Xenophilus sp. AP218F]